MPFLKDAALPVGHDGPNWWTGTVTLPDVWQVDNVAVQLYKPGDTQRTLSKNITHAWFPKDAFDQIRWEPSGDSTIDSLLSLRRESNFTRSDFAITVAPCASNT